MKTRGRVLGTVLCLLSGALIVPPSATSAAAADLPSIFFGPQSVGTTSSVLTVPVSLATTLGAVQTALADAIAGVTFPALSSGAITILDANQVKAAVISTVAAMPDATPLAFQVSSIDLAGGRNFFTRGGNCVGAHGAPCFGREDRRTTGSRGLPNEPTATWAEFYAANRLIPLAKSARDEDALPESAIAAMERLAVRLDEFGGADEPPARLHGDLWAGNRLVDADGRSWLIDPAAHGGHREFDLAMMRLFGGFGADCFAAYADVFPLANSWSERVALHQIAPLVVHAIKFGGGYVGAAANAINQYR